MKILVTGATGFIGSRLALEARKAGHDIVASGQLNSDPEHERARELESAGIRIEKGQLQNPEHARWLAAECQAVIHLAAAQHESNVPDEYFIDVNVNGTRTLIDAAKSEAVQRFVYGSTIGIYGESRGQVLDENTPPSPANVYGRSKLMAEEVVNSYRSALPISIVRISETYGPGDFRLLKLFRAVDRGPLPDHRLRPESAPGNPCERSDARLAAGREQPGGGGRDLCHGGRGNLDDARYGAGSGRRLGTQCAARPRAAVAASGYGNGDGAHAPPAGPSAASAPSAAGFFPQVIRLFDGQSALDARFLTRHSI